MDMVKSAPIVNLSKDMFLYALTVKEGTVTGVKILVARAVI